MSTGTGTVIMRVSELLADIYSASAARQAFDIVLASRRTKAVEGDAARVTAERIGDVVLDDDEVHFWLGSLRERNPESPAPARVGELPKWLPPRSEGFECFVVQRVVDL